MMTLSARFYVDDSDLEAIAQLLNQCERVDQEGNYYTSNSLRMEFTSPGCTPERNIRLWYDDHQKLIAFGQLWIPPDQSELDVSEASERSMDGFLWFRVHPQWRHQGWESEIIAWGEAGLRTAAAQAQRSAKLSLSCRDSQLDRIDLFLAHGYVHERTFLRMSRSLTLPIAPAQLPPGFTLLAGSEINTAAWVDLHNQTFIDHWNYHPSSVEEEKHWRADPHYRPELDVVAIAPDGTYAAFCYGYIDPEENAQQHRQDGWINMLGTRRGFRRLGLGRAMLLTGLERLRSIGMETAFLGVDSENPNQAKRLYESVGFQKRFANLCYRKRL